MPAFDDPGSTTLEEMMKAVNFYVAGAKSTDIDAQSAITEQKKIAENTTGILQQVSADSSTVSAAASAAILDEQARKAKVAAIMGVDINAQNERYSNLTSIRDKAQDEKDQALAAIKEKQSVSVFTNPIQYLVNQFTVNNDIIKHNTANHQLESATSGIDTLNKEAQDTFKTQQALTVGVTVASAAAAARNAGATAAVQANQSAISAWQYDVTQVDRAMNTSKEIYQALYTADNAQRTEKGLQLQQQQLDLARANAAEHIREFNIGDEIRQSTEEVAKGYLNSINLGRAARGAEPLDDTSAKGVMLYFKTGKGMFNNMMQTDLANGETARVAGRPVIATSPVGLLTMVGNNIPINFTPAQLAVKNLIASTSASAGGVPSPDAATAEFQMDVAKAKASKDPQAIAAVVNKRVQTVFDNAATNINPSDGSNPYNIGSINALAASSPTVANLPVYQKVLAKRAANGEQFTDHKMIFSAVVDALNKKEITMGEALETTTMFQVGVNANIAQRGFQSVAGIIPKLSYNTSIEIDKNSFSGTRIIDMTRPDQLQRALMLALKAREAQADLDEFMVNPIISIQGNR